ncbi:MAG: DUF3713 domain-containing protein [Mycoplasmoidaceae bacterium]
MKKKKIELGFFKSKIFWSSFGLLAILGATTLGASSCSLQQSNQKIIDKGDWNYFAKNDVANSNISLNDGIKAALQNPDGINNFFSSKFKSLMLDIVDNLAKNSATVSTDKQNQLAKDNDDYNSFLKGIKSSGRDWGIAVQSELDKNGGTESSWKQKRLEDWATNYINDLFFKSDYSNIYNVDSQGNKTWVSNPLPNTVAQALENKVKNLNVGVQMGFCYDGKSSPFSEDFGQANAQLQKYVYNAYINDEKPFTVNMNLWKYATTGVGSSTDDIWSKPDASSYNSSNLNVDPPPPSTEGPGTYINPYFSQTTSDPTKSDAVDKFINFNLANISKIPSVTKIEKNFIPNKFYGVDNSGIGLRDDMQMNWTDDSANYILVEPDKWGLVNEFEMAAFNLFNLDNGIHATSGSPTPTSNLFQSTPGDWVGGSAAKINDQFDPITRSFMSNVTPTGVNYSRIVNADFKRMLNKNNPSLNSVFSSSNDVYSIDAFHSKNGNPTDDFIYLRNQFGVHAIALDGWNYIKTGTTFKERISKAGDILLYRSLQNKFNKDSGIADEPTKSFAIKLNDNLKDYYTKNQTKIWVSLLKDAKNDPDSEAGKIVKKLFGDVSVDKLVEPDLLNLFDKYNQYISYQNNVKNVDTRNSGLLTAKNAYSKNFGQQTYKNGIAAPFPYKQESDGKFSEILMFLNDNHNYDSNGLAKIYNELYIDINSYVDNKKFRPLSDVSSQTFKYSQFIFSNDASINYVLSSFTTNSDYYTKLATNKVIENAELFKDGTGKSMYMKDIMNLKDIDSTTPPISDFVTYNIDSINGFNSINNTDFNFELINQFLGASITSNSMGDDALSLMSLTNPHGAVSVNEIQKYKELKYFKNAYDNNVNFQTIKQNLFKLNLALVYLAQDANGLFKDQSRLLNKVSSEINQNEDAEFSWWDSISSSMFTNPTFTSINTPEKLLEQSQTIPSSIFLNQNNSSYSQYISNNDSQPPSQVNGKNTNIYDNSSYGQTNAFLYSKDSANKLLSGYVGLQKESTTKMPDSLKKYMFPNGPRRDGDLTNINGVLYKYGSIEELTKLIEDSQNSNQIDMTATDINNSLNSNEVSIIVQKILNSSDLKTKKEIFKNELDSKIDPKAFEKYNGYANGSSNWIAGVDHFTSYAGYLQQVNYDDLNYKKDPTTHKVEYDKEGNPIKINNIEDLINNIGASQTIDLLIKYASDSGIQSIAFNNFARSHQFNIYDLNTRNSFGEMWVRNYNLG